MCVFSASVLQPEGTLSEDLDVAAHTYSEPPTICIPKKRADELPNCAAFTRKSGSYQCALCEMNHYLGKAVSDQQHYCYKYRCPGGYRSPNPNDGCDPDANCQQVSRSRGPWQISQGKTSSGKERFHCLFNNPEGCSKVDDHFHRHRLLDL